MNTTESAGSNVSGMFASFGAVAANYMQDKMHKKMDSDASGTVDKGEFKAALDQLGLKLGMDGTADADAMFASVDADGNGSLTGSEVGQIIKNAFSGQVGTDTNAFVQSRGDEQRFAELDADGDGTISMAEFGINAGSPTTAEGTEPGSTEMGVGDPITGALPASVDDTAVAALNGNAVAKHQMVASAAETNAAAPLNEDALKALMGSVDRDGNGKISGQEINAFVAQLSGQMGVASKKYNDTALASFSTNKLNAAA